MRRADVKFSYQFLPSRVSIINFLNKSKKNPLPLRFFDFVLKYYYRVIFADKHTI
jgi:hypothetical protein